MSNLLVCPLKAAFISVSVFLVSSISFQFFLSFLSAYIAHLSLHEAHYFIPKGPYHLITVKIPSRIILSPLNLVPMLALLLQTLFLSFIILAFYFLFLQEVRHCV